MNKREIKIGYLCKTTTTITGYYRNSNGWDQTEMVDFHCCGLKCDCENICFTLQDYERFIDLEHGYRPKDERSSDKTWGQEKGTTTEVCIISNGIVKALNEAFSELYSIHFVCANQNDELLYDFCEVIGCEEYQDFERYRFSFTYNLKLKIYEIDKQIEDLQKQRDNLLNTIPYQKEIAEQAFKKITENDRISVNAIIPNLQMYPLDVALKKGDKDMLEYLLRAGAIKCKNRVSRFRPLKMESWYGFFKLWKHLGFQPVKAHLLLDKMHLLPDDVIISIFSKNNTEVLYEDITLSRDCIQTIRNLITELYEKRSNQETEKDLLCLFEKLIISKRYGVINVITDFLFNEEWWCEYNELLLACCIKHKDFEALQNIEICILRDFDKKSLITEVEDIFNHYYNVEYLGSEMMDYIQKMKI